MPEDLEEKIDKAVADVKYDPREASYLSAFIISGFDIKTYGMITFTKNEKSKTTEIIAIHITKCL